MIPKSDIDRLLKAIDGEELIELTADLVRDALCGQATRQAQIDR